MEDRDGLIINYCRVICFQKSNLYVWPIPVNPFIPFHLKQKLEVFWKVSGSKSVWMRGESRAVAEAQPWRGAQEPWRCWQPLGSALPVAPLAQIHPPAALQLPGIRPCWKVPGIALASWSAVSQCSETWPVHSWNSRLPTAAALPLLHSLDPPLPFSQLTSAVHGSLRISQTIPFLPLSFAFSWGHSLPVESWIHSKSFSCFLCSGKSPAHYCQVSLNS